MPSHSLSLKSKLSLFTALLFVSHDRRLAHHFPRDLALPLLNRTVAGGVACAI